MYNKAKEIKIKELPSDMFALFIDAYHTQIKDEETKRIKKAVIYNIVGIDMEGRKSLVSYYIYFGSESKEDWLHLKLPIGISFWVILSSLRCPFA